MVFVTCLCLQGGAVQFKKIEKTTGEFNVLVADDFAVNRTLCKGMLELMGCIVSLASDGRQAVDAFKQEDFDVILMDVMMPELDGFQATAEIRALEGSLGKRPYIIALTANGLIGDREKCLSAGMDDYISKPLKAASLTEALRVYSESKAIMPRDET
jgi:two-component system sensor histidine kinase/response regulator